MPRSVAAAGAFLLVLVAVMPGILGNPQCARWANCDNLVGGDQYKPILSGVQRYAGPDGFCVYGHGGAERLCSPGMPCGETTMRCECVSEERATTEQHQSAIIRLICGALLAVGGLLCLCLRFRWFVKKRLQDRVTPWVNCDEAQFSAVVVGVPIGQIAPQRIQRRPDEAVVAGARPDVEAARCLAHRSGPADDATIIGVGAAPAQPTELARIPEPVSMEGAWSRPGVLTGSYPPGTHSDQLPVQRVSRRRDCWDLVITTMLTVVFPTTTTACGVAIFHSGLLRRIEVYFNECEG